jgi:hypothetical protein
MLGSNQRPLSCEGSTTISWLFAVVRNYLEISTFTLTTHRMCASLFAWAAAHNACSDWLGPATLSETNLLINAEDTEE